METMHPSKWKQMESSNLSERKVEKELLELELELEQNWNKTNDIRRFCSGEQFYRILHPTISSDTVQQKVCTKQGLLDILSNIYE